jgi:hypothetical protein
MTEDVSFVLDAVITLSILNIMQAASVAALITCSLTAAKTLQDLLQKHSLDFALSELAEIEVHKNMPRIKRPDVN